MKVVVSDQKTGKAYMASLDHDLFLGKKIGEVVKLDELGLAGYEGKILGGSDKQGFPMNVSLVGSMRKKIFTGDAPGFRATRKGERRRISVRGNAVSNEIAQVNVVVTKVGSTDINTVLGKKGATPEDTMSAKERSIKKSLEMAGAAELGSGVKKAKH
ncbi:MAG: S6e family ribosomal protein [archaeon]